MPFASTIMMMRPASFGFNEQTASNNAFQQKVVITDVLQKALKEFDRMVATIRTAGIDVVVIDDTPEPPKPDAIFPNNWFCSLPDGSLHVFPMYAENRRLERRMDIIDQLHETLKAKLVYDWSKGESTDEFLESTGSMVMDHDNKIIYAAISPRTDVGLLKRFAECTGYEYIPFNTKDPSGLPVYHTNVLMCIGNKFCIVCDEVINEKDQEIVFTSLKKNYKQLIKVSFEQISSFAGNMLQLENKNRESLLVMSSSAFDALTLHQKNILEIYTGLLPVDIATIEKIGGGSARCMMAELFFIA